MTESQRVTIQMKVTEAGEQNFPVVLFITLCKMVLNFESVDEILKCDHSNLRLLSSAVYYAVQDGFTF